jgi:hypothetical protein
MQKVSDLRAKYYEELTQERKLEQHNTSCIEHSAEKNSKRKQIFLKYKATFSRIVNSDKMKLKLNPKIMRWVQHFSDNLMARIGKTRTAKVVPRVFQRLASEQS